MEFSDGMKFDTSGAPRVVHRSDGWYVVGDRMLIPVSSEEEGLEIVADMKRVKERKS